MKPLRVSWYSANKLEIHDPANIQFAAPAVLIKNLYTPLLIYNELSEIDFGLAKEFNWISESEIEFIIRDNLKSSKGDLITAEDVYLNFKRLMVLQTNTHGDLQNFLCPNIKLKSMNDTCSGLRFKENKLYLKAENEKLAKFLVPLIASCDFTIIPKTAIDWNSPTLKITDYSNTSGPYYVESTNEKHEHILKANINSPLYSHDMPQLIQLIPILDTSSPAKFRNKEVDMITTVDRATPNEMLNFENNQNYSFHKTLELEVTSLVFTKVGNSKFNSVERISIGKIIKGNILKNLSSDNSGKNTTQFFPSFSEGGLNQGQIEKLELIFRNSNTLPNRKIKISVESYKLNLFKSIFKDYPNIEFIKFNGMPNKKTNEEMEDAFIIPSDTGFYENISLLSYYISTNQLAFSSESEGKKWIQEYIQIDDKVERLNKLRKLHFDTLAGGYIIPISITPYFAVINKEWSLNFYKNFASTPLWMIRKN